MTLRRDKVHAEDCATCETQSGKIDQIERQIKITGDLTDEERTKLMEIADKCQSTGRHIRRSGRKAGSRIRARTVPRHRSPR